MFVKMQNHLTPQGARKQLKKRERVLAQKEGLLELIECGSADAVKAASAELRPGATRELPFEVQKGAMNPPAQGRVYGNASLVMGAPQGSRIHGKLAWIVV